MHEAAQNDRFLTVDPQAEGTRLDRFLARQLADVSRSRIQKLIHEGRILLDGEKCRPSTPVRSGQVVRWPADAATVAVSIAPEAIPIEVVLEDDDILVLHKPPGLVVHPAPGHWHGTLVNGLLHRWPGWCAPGGPDRPGVVHRLDLGTSGLMVIARSPRAYRSLRQQISTHQVERAYVALVWGAMEGESGEIDAPIGRDPRNRKRMAVVPGHGRPAQTLWHVLSRFDTFTLLHIVLRTGRTHQVRVHLASVGHPVFGDPTYGGVEFVSRLAPRDRPRVHRWLRALRRPALHAYRLGFRHPADGAWLTFEAPVPPDLEGVLIELAGSEGER